MRDLFETTIERIFSDLVSPALIHRCAAGVQVRPGDPGDEQRTARRGDGDTWGHPHRETDRASVIRTRGVG